jgi:hypothetical protein
LKHGVALRHGMTARGWLERVTLRAEEAGDQFLLPPEIVPAADSPRERRAEDDGQSDCRGDGLETGEPPGQHAAIEPPAGPEKERANRE